MHEWCSVWTSYQEGRIRPLDVRTWLALREVAERRKFLSRGREALYRLGELESLIGRVGQVKLRASLRRLKKARLASWSPKGPQFLKSNEGLDPKVLARTNAMLALMPPKRKSFPMPRRTLRLLAGGVKKSVLATIVGQLIWCVYFNRQSGWAGKGLVSAKTLGQVFGIDARSVERARAHLQNELGWLRQLPCAMWRKKKYGGHFEVNLAWNHTDTTAVGEGSDELSTAILSEVNRPTEPVLSELESEQPSSTKIQVSTPRVGQANPRPRDDSSKKSSLEPKPNLRKVVKDDLRCVHRVMKLFDQALTSPVWKSKGHAPSDTCPERLNWAAAARRALVRGGENPCGLFLHLVSHRKWLHISNDDENAVQQAFSEWRDGVEVGAYCARRRDSLDNDELYAEEFLANLTRSSFSILGVSDISRKV